MSPARIAMNARSSCLRPKTDQSTLNLAKDAGPRLQAAPTKHRRELRKRRSRGGNRERRGTDGMLLQTRTMIPSKRTLPTRTTRPQTTKRTRNLTKTVERTLVTLWTTMTTIRRRGGGIRRVPRARNGRPLSALLELLGDARLSCQRRMKSLLWTFLFQSATNLGLGQGVGPKRRRKRRLQWSLLQRLQTTKPPNRRNPLAVFWLLQTRTPANSFPMGKTSKCSTWPI